MDSAARRSGGGIVEGIHRVVMRRNSVYVTFIIAGAFFGERAVDYGVEKLWERNNVGKRYEDISVLGRRQSEERVFELHALGSSDNFKIHKLKISVFVWHFANN